MASNKSSTGLLLMGGATLVYLMKKGKAQDSSSNFSGGSGSGSGLVLVSPSGFGSSEVTNPNSSPLSLPNVIINESPLPQAPTDNMTKKEASSTQFVQSGADKLFDPQGVGLAGGYYDNSGKLVGVADPIAKQSRLPTPTEQLLNTPSYSGGGSGSTKKSSASSGTTTGTFQGLPVSIPSSSTSTKKESSTTPVKTSVISKIGSVVGSIIKRGIFR